MLEDMPAILEPLFPLAQRQPRERLSSCCTNPPQIFPYHVLNTLMKLQLNVNLDFFKGFFSLASIHMFHFLVVESSLLVFEHLRNFIQSQRST
jgi:hypothetical protein